MKVLETKDIHINRDHFENHLSEDYRQMTLESRKGLWADERKVSISSSFYSTGRRRDSGKRWFKWETDSVYGFFRMSNGGIMPYYRAKIKGRWINQVPVVPFAILRQDVGRQGEMFTEFQRLCLENLEISSLKDVYPISDLYSISSMDGIPKNVKRAMRNDDFKDFVAEVWGKKNMRKDLVKANGNANIQNINYLTHFKNRVPIDWIIKTLNENVAPVRLGQTHYAPINITPILNAIDPKSYKNLLSIAPNETYGITDTIRWLKINNWDMQSIQGKKFKSWTEIHDAVYNIGRRRRHVQFEWVEPVERPKPKPIEIKFNDLTEIIHNSEWEGMKFICPEGPELMIEWSNYMHNCISSYAREASNNAYVGVYKDDVLIANIEVTSGNMEWKLNQLLGKYNAPLDEKLVESIESYLRTLNVTIPDQYWGARPLLAESAPHAGFRVAAAAERW